MSYISGGQLSAKILQLIDGSSVKRSVYASADYSHELLVISL